MVMEQNFVCILGRDKSLQEKQPGQVLTGSAHLPHSGVEVVASQEAQNSATNDASNSRNNNQPVDVDVDVDVGIEDRRRREDAVGVRVRRRIQYGGEKCLGTTASSVVQPRL